MKKVLPILGLFLIGCNKLPIGGSINGPTVSKNGFPIYVMIGHSNMLGRGSAPSTYSKNPNIVMFEQDGWAVAQEPTGLDPTAGVSAGVAFATARGLGDRIGIINCASGGSTTYQIGPGYPLYDECIARIAKASKDGYIAGILAWTGENDAVESDWTESFTDIIKGFRQVSGNPNLPVVYARVNQNPWMTVLRTAEDSFSMAHVRMVDTDDLPRQDGVHLTSGGEETLGIRFASMIETI